MLLTTEIELLLQEQYDKIWIHKVDFMTLDVICKVYHPSTGDKWYLISQDPNNKDSLWGIISTGNTKFGVIQKVEMEGFSKEGKPCEIDQLFPRMKVSSVYQILLENQ